MSAPNKPDVSPELKEAFKEFARVNEAKYGPDWKEKLAAEFAEKHTPVLCDLRDLLSGKTIRRRKVKT